MATIKCTVQRSNWYEMYIEYTVSTNNSTKKSTITHSLKIKQLTNSNDFSGDMNVTYKIAGNSFTYDGNFDMDDKGDAGYTKTIKSGTTTISHDATTGAASFTVSCSGSCNSGGWGPGTISLSSRTVNCPRIPLYKLTVSAGTGSTIAVNRTSSSGDGKTGSLSNGASLYYGDRLRITFTAQTNYSVTTRTVNGSTFTSGNTHTVSGNVSVASTATPLKSLIGATDANIESSSAITVTRYNTSFTHTITYKFGSEEGVIATKSTNESISWTIPTEFYTQIPNEKTGVCTLTCETFNGDTSLGSNTCTLTVTADPNKCKPVLSATVKDINDTTIALTGDGSVLIRYKSNALCEINATPKNSSTISSLSINGTTLTGDTIDGVTTAAKSYPGVSDLSFNFKSIDSRGYSDEVTQMPTVVAYINLSCNPILSRPTPTGGSIEMTFTGDFFRGSFGACSNTLTLQYRYRVSGGPYGSWQTIDSTNIVFGTSSYSSSETITLGEDFDYRSDYEFEVRATDGGVVGGTEYVLSTVTKTIPVRRGIPVFDWGENDFNINVPLMLNNVNILNIMYPVGAVYMHSGGTLPTAISEIGTWTSVTTDISGVYAWKRTA